MDKFVFKKPRVKNLSVLSHSDSISSSVTIASTSSQDTSSELHTPKVPCVKNASVLSFSRDFSSPGSTISSRDTASDLPKLKRSRVENENASVSSYKTGSSAPNTTISAQDTASNLTIKKTAGKGRTFQIAWLNKFKWLEWNANIEKAFCKTCKDALCKGLFSSSTKKEETFISTGFSNWKKALEKFRAHENTHVHKEGLMKLASLTKPCIATQLNDQNNAERIKSRTALMAIFTSIKYLCRQGLAIRGHSDISSNFQQLLEVRRVDVPALDEWLKRKGYKWLSHDIQNEMIQILADAVLRSLITKIKKCKFFAILVDETCDVSTHEQVSFCVRTVNDNFEVSEDFLGLYETPNTTSATIFNVVKDILLRLDLQFENLRGQCYDGASNMRGKFNGLQKLVSDLQPQATYVHCTAHSLNLAVEDSLRHLPKIRDTMNLAKDLINTVRESPKRMNMFRSSYVEDNEAEATINLRPLCPTRWTMRASSMEQILKHYERLLQFFEEFSSENSSDAASKCAGYLDTMIQFKSYFLITLYCHIMNPVEDINSKIQSPSFGATELNEKLQYLSDILLSKRSDFDLFWQRCVQGKPASVEDPVLPRQRYIPKKLDSPRASAPHIYQTPEAYFKQMYNETVDTVLGCVNERVQLTGLKKVIMVEKELVNIANNELHSLKEAKNFFQSDIDDRKLQLHLQMLGDISKRREVSLNSMTDITNKLQEDNTLSELLPELLKAIKILRTVPVTAATTERSFSALRRLKSYLRSTMGQKRLNSLAILNSHQNVLDLVIMEQVVNEFIKSNPIRFATFAQY